MVDYLVESYSKPCPPEDLFAGLGRHRWHNSDVHSFSKRLDSFSKRLVQAENSERAVESLLPICCAVFNARHYLFELKGPVRPLHSRYDVLGIPALEAELGAVQG